MDEIIEYMLREDEGFGDITSNALIPENKIFYAKLISKDDGILAALQRGLGSMEPVGRGQARHFQESGS